MKTPEEAARFRVEKALEHSPASTPDLEGWERFARAAEQAGIESVLISFSRVEPDPMLVSCALGRAVEKLKFIYRELLIAAHRETIAAAQYGRLLSSGIATNNTSPALENTARGVNV